MDSPPIDSELKARLIDLAKWGLNGIDNTEDGFGITDINLVAKCLNQIIAVLEEAGQ